MGEDHAEVQAAGFGEHVFYRIGEIEEVLELVEVQGGVPALGFREASAGGGRLPDLRGQHAAEESGGVVAEDALGEPREYDPVRVDRGFEVEGALG
jgi:hypothetical protein